MLKSVRGMTKRLTEECRDQAHQRRIHEHLDKALPS
jgi:hypothetical protein